MIKDALSGRILELNLNLLHGICRIKVECERQCSIENATMPENLRIPQSTTWKIPKISASNILDIIESTVVVFASYAVKTCTVEKVVVGPWVGIKRALE